MKRDAVMCERCVAIDKQVANFRRIQADATDRLAILLLAESISDLEDEKAGLHPTTKAPSSGF